MARIRIKGRTEAILKYLSAALAVLTLVASLITSIGIDRFSDDDVNETESFTKHLKQQIAELDSLNRRLDREQQKIRDLNKTLGNRIIVNLDSFSTLNKQNVEIQLLRNDLKKVENSLNTLNGIILDNPEKALTMPLLKQKIESISQEVLKGDATLKGEIDRVYDMNKWIFGLVISMLVSLVALNLSNLLGRKDKAEKEKEKAKEQ